VHSSNEGVNALDLIQSEPLEKTDFMKAHALLEANYGTEYKREKMLLLLEMILEEGWTKERFQRTLRWFIKNKPFPAWTIADWFAYKIPVYGYSWYLAQCAQGYDVRKDMDIYELEDGTRVYRWHDEQELPFRKVDPL
jgi:hypothetical protein